MHIFAARFSPICHFEHVRVAKKPRGAALLGALYRIQLNRSCKSFMQQTATGFKYLGKYALAATSVLRCDEACRLTSNPASTRSRKEDPHGDLGLEV